MAVRLPRIERVYDAAWRAWECASAWVVMRPLDDKAGLAVCIALMTVELCAADLAAEQSDDAGPAC